MQLGRLWLTHGVAPPSGCELRGRLRCVGVFRNGSKSARALLGAVRLRGPSRSGLRWTRLELPTVIADVAHDIPSQRVRSCGSHPRRPPTLRGCLALGIAALALGCSSTVTGHDDATDAVDAAIADEDAATDAMDATHIVNTDVAGSMDAADACPAPPFERCGDWAGCSQGLCFGQMGFVWSSGRCVQIWGCHISSPAPDLTLADCIAHHADCANAVDAGAPISCGEGGVCPDRGDCAPPDRPGGTRVCVPHFEARGCGFAGLCP